MKFIRVSVYAVWLVVVMRMSFFASPSFSLSLPLSLSCQNNVHCVFQTLNPFSL